MKRLTMLILLLCSTLYSYGQSAKSFYKTGLEFSENKNYNDAITQFTKAIDIEPDYANAYIERGRAYKQQGQIKKASEDFDRATIFITNDEELFYESAQLFYDLGEYKKAIEKLDRAIKVKSTYLEAYRLLIKTLIADGNIANAKIISERALMRKNDALNNYYYGYTLYHLKDLMNAEKYLNIAIKKDDGLADAYYCLAKVKQDSKNYDEAISYCTEALKIVPNNIDFFILRSSIYKDKIELNAAINDISKAIVLKPDNPDYYFIRGNYYQDFTQYQNAINDFNKVIILDKDHKEAYYHRAKMYEEIANYKAAIKDYQKLIELTPSDSNTIELLADVEGRLYELNREENKPTVNLIDPLPKDELVIYLPQNKTELIVKGEIVDESKLDKLVINGNKTPFTTEDNKSEFLATINLANIESIIVEATDIYDNKEVKKYTVHRTEINPPTVKIIAPYASDNGEIYLASNDPSLYIEGKIGDESKIETILVDGVVASYKIDEFNPVFSATIGIQNKDKFTVRVIDIYGNETQQEFLFNREGATIAEDNPMGKTWVVFIENSNYENFPSLDGPTKDISAMRSALANYQVHNFIHKKDLTKIQLERFFNIELRDLVRSNQVNSILIWYAGHGKFLNETGYWIPTDANRDDEFSYFNTGNLKASMQLYSKYITHLLLITDACESGPTFYQAMRNIPEAKSCNDWTATRFKSSQVFSSAGYELAVDNSQFTRTFANTLSNNPDPCIPIESIVQKVTKAVAENNQQKPVFGKISGLEDENGTYFFISK